MNLCDLTCLCETLVWVTTLGSLGQEDSSRTGAENLEYGAIPKPSL